MITSRRRFVIYSAVISLITSGIVITSLLIREKPETQSPLDGEIEHDFGEIRYRGAVLNQDHIFRLKNITSQPIKITKVAPTCGCTVANVSQNLIQPGESTEIKVTLTFQEAIYRKERIWLALENWGALALTVSGTARRIHHFYALQEAVPLSRTGREEIILVAIDYDTDIKPREPEVLTPDGVFASFAGWKMVFPHEETTKRPARWQAIVSLTATDTSSIKPGQRTVISLDDEQHVKVELTGRPWRVDPATFIKRNDESG